MARSLDRKTVEAVYRRYGAQVERCCRRILGDGDEAADATHDVFLRLFDHGGAFRAEADWMTWLYRVSTNLCLSRLSKAKNRRRILDHHGDPMRPRAVFDPAMLADRDILRALLARVNARTQEIVIYYHLYEMSQQEIAALVGLSRVSVNKRLKKFEDEARTYLQAMKAA